MILEPAESLLMQEFLARSFISRLEMYAIVVQDKDIFSGGVGRFAETVSSLKRSKRRSGGQSFLSTSQAADASSKDDDTIDCLPATTTSASAPPMTLQGALAAARERSPEDEPEGLSSLEPQKSAAGAGAAYGPDRKLSHPQTLFDGQNRLIQLLPPVLGNMSSLTGAFAHSDYIINEFHIGPGNEPDGHEFSEYAQFVVLSEDGAPYKNQLNVLFTKNELLDEFLLGCKANLYVMLMSLGPFHTRTDFGQGVLHIFSPYVAELFKKVGRDSKKQVL